MSRSVTALRPARGRAGWPGGRAQLNGRASGQAADRPSDLLSAPNSHYAVCGARRSTTNERIAVVSCGGWPTERTTSQRRRTSSTLNTRRWFRLMTWLSCRRNLNEKCGISISVTLASWHLVAWNTTAFRFISDRPRYGSTWRLLSYLCRRLPVRCRWTATACVWDGITTTENGSTKILHLTLFGAVHGNYSSHHDVSNIVLSRVT